MFKVVKSSFAVIGKEGSTYDGEGFIKRLWEDANGHFQEVSHLVKRKPDGTLAGIWGVMSDMSRSFRPWENEFSTGLYLAGAECNDDVVPPEGWKKWTIPGYEYLVVENSPHAFEDTIDYLRDNGIELVGAVHDYTDPISEKSYLYFPVQKMFNINA